MKPGATKEQAKDDRGIRCPRCGCGHWRVVYTRAAFGNQLVRRRECRYCGKRLTTTERAHAVPRS